MAEAPHSLRVFVNAIGIDVPVGTSALEAVRLWSADEADKLARGERVITDSRGLPVAADTPVRAGSIFRLLPARKAPPRGEADAAEHDGEIA